jgi:hypothetical protein
MAFAGAAVLVLLTLLIQTLGMALLVQRIRVRLPRGAYPLGVFRSCVLMMRFTIAIFILHLLQILLWAGYYHWTYFPSWEAAFYFSATSYSTVGYGDVLLPLTWRCLGPVESVTGVLMCGLSAALLFAIVRRLVEHAGGNPSTKDRV